MVAQCCLTALGAIARAPPLQSIPEVTRRLGRPRETHPTETAFEGAREAFSQFSRRPVNEAAVVKALNHGPEALLALINKRNKKAKLEGKVPQKPESPSGWINPRGGKAKADDRLLTPPGKSEGLEEEEAEGSQKKKEEKEARAKKKKEQKELEEAQAQKKKEEREA